MSQSKIKVEGFAGKIAAQFLHSKLTPVIAVTSVLLGLMAAAAVVYFGALWAAGLKLRQTLRR